MAAKKKTTKTTKKIEPIKSVKMETSKLMLWISYSITAILVFLVILCTFLNIECSNIASILPYAFGEVATVNGAYLLMNRRLNAPKVVMHLYNELPKEVRDQVDINNLLSNILN